MTTATAPAPTHTLAGGQTCACCGLTDGPDRGVAMERITVPIAVRRGYEPTPAWICVASTPCLNRAGVKR